MVRMDEKSDDIAKESDPMIGDHRLNTGQLQESPDNGRRIALRCSPNQGFRRYKPALAALAPTGPKVNVPGSKPVDNVGFMSHVTLTWISKYAYKAYKRGFVANKWPSLSLYDRSDSNVKRFDLMWKDEVARRGPEEASFGAVVWRFIGTRTLIAVAIFWLSTVFGFLSQMVSMRKLLEYIEAPKESWQEGVKWATLFILTEVFRWFLFGWTCSMTYRTAIRLKLACMRMLYRKVIRLNDLGNTSVGQLINIFSIDCQRIFEMVYLTPLVSNAPVIIACGIWYIFGSIGPMALLGILVCTTYFFLQFGLSHITGYIRSRGLKIADSRIQLTNEILDYMKLIKMYAWEKSFSRTLRGIRNREQKLVLATNYTRSLAASLANSVPYIATTVSFLSHLSTGQNLSTAQAFPVLSFFGSQMTQLFSRAKDGFLTLADSFVALRRIKKILIIEEHSCPMPKPIHKSQALVIGHGNFAYSGVVNQTRGQLEKHSDKGKNTHTSSEDESEATQLKVVSKAEVDDVLFDITLDVSKGHLIGICGQVGSGKSSLLLAALGQMRITGGQVTRDGSCAYVSQQAWILNATIRENILFGHPLVAERYHQTLSLCNLIHDLEVLQGGDQTEIGEKGINLSGGQKQRIALARAFYADKDIYFLDDPLSAVDVHVGLYIFNNLIVDALSSKTVIFVTHQIQYLNRCDGIYMMRDGRIVEYGTHDELMKMDQEYAFMVNATSDKYADTKIATSVDENVKDYDQSNNVISAKINNRGNPVGDNPNVVIHHENPAEGKATLTKAEDNEEGVVTGQTYLSYGSAAGGWFAVLMIFTLTVLTIGSTSFSNWWLARWINAGGGSVTDSRSNATVSSNNMNDNPDFFYYKTIYGSSIALVLSATIVRSLVLCKANIRASTTFHNKLFHKIMISPMRFFDTTPTGRIQNLFSRDMDEVDNRLPISIDEVLLDGVLIVIAVLIICVVFPWFILPICILGVFYYSYCQIYRVASRGLKRVESTTRGPILSHVTATVQGLNTIHAFEKVTDFEMHFGRLLDDNGNYLFLHTILNRWVGFRLDGLTIFMLATTVSLALFTKGQIPPSLAGLALTNTALISSMLQYVIRVASNTETQFISVERINNYINLPDTDGNNDKALVKAIPEWPKTGAIRFEKVIMSYGKDTPLVLKEVTFSVEPCEKIGIVGRTGSGKSSLTVALFRLVELSAGSIMIDDVDIAGLELEQLRTRLSIIPQDPILFSGTIRSNLDPFKVHTDLELWDALEKTQLKERVQSIAGHLDTNVGFGGDNLSVGERQLLCLARALLRRAKILVLDEATAAVDPETEIAVQNTIQREFSDSTVLTIAHRLQTVVSCDRILVMDDGRVAEFDKPSTLLADGNSHFAKIMAAAEKAMQR